MLLMHARHCPARTVAHSLVAMSGARWVREIRTRLSARVSELKIFITAPGRPPKTPDKHECEAQRVLPVKSAGLPNGMTEHQHCSEHETRRFRDHVWAQVRRIGKERMRLACLGLNVSIDRNAVGMEVRRVDDALYYVITCRLCHDGLNAGTSVPWLQWDAS